MKTMAHDPNREMRLNAKIIFAFALLVLLVLFLDPEIVHFEDNTYRLILRGCYLISHGPFAGLYCE